MNGCSREMELDKALAILRERKPDFEEKYGVTRIGIFGSIAHGDATAESDIDIIVEMPPKLFDMVHIKGEPEEAFAIHVDILRHNSHMFEPLRVRIEREAIYV